MKITVISHHGNDGSQCLKNGEVDLAVLGGNVKTRRASFILPVHPIKRRAFKALRWMFGDKGKVAAWTRRWRGPWEAYIIATGESKVFPRRISCLLWEEQRINAYLMN
jgi:hypothetical protein